MIEQFQFRLKITDPTNDPFLRSPAKGTLMHGVLMKAVDCENLHFGSSLRPYSQFLRKSETPCEYIWTISLLDSCKCSMLKRWIESQPAEIFVRHYNLVCVVEQINCVQQSSYEELLGEVFEQLPPKYASFEFLTPLVFKKSGTSNPWPFPEPRLILQSVLARWNCFSDTAKFEAQEIFDTTHQFVRLQTYKVQSQNVSMDGTIFAGTIGSVSFNVQKDELRQLMNLAGRYAEFSGVGAKTAMGLGATRYTAALLPKKNANLSKCATSLAL